jgi:hypothetical protein
MDLKKKKKDISRHIRRGNLGSACAMGNNSVLSNFPPFA